MISTHCAMERDRRSRSWLAGEYLGRNLIPPKGRLRHFSEMKACYLALFPCSLQSCLVLPGCGKGVQDTGSTTHQVPLYLFSITCILTQMYLPGRHPPYQLCTISLPPVCFICFEHLPHESWGEKFMSSFDCRAWDLGERKPQNREQHL